MLNIYEDIIAQLFILIGNIDIPISDQKVSLSKFSHEFCDAMVLKGMYKLWDSALYVN